MLAACAFFVYLAFRSEKSDAVVADARALAEAGAFCVLLEMVTTETARRVADLGAGEILLTSMDRDGTRIGFDLELTRAVCDAVPIPERITVRRLSLVISANVAGALV